jgi:hypothetical protein
VCPVQIPVTSRIYVYVPIDPPPGIPDVTVYPPEVALVTDDGQEPADGDYHPAAWIDGEMALLVGPNGGVVYPAGDYFCYGRLTAGQEQPVMPSGRVRIGLGKIP